MDEARILDAVRSPADLKVLTDEELAILAQEIREEMVSVTSRTGGHLASSLGAVEIILAVHSLIDAPKDRFVFDVGHRLDEIVDAVSAEDVTLDEALALYEEAVKLGLSACDLSERDVEAAFPEEAAGEEGAPAPAEAADVEGADPAPDADGEDAPTPAGPAPDAPAAEPRPQD